MPAINFNTNTYNNNRIDGANYCPSSANYNARGLNAAAYSPFDGRVTTWNQNLPFSTVGQQGWLGQDKTAGYGLDLGWNGSYKAGQSAVLAFDFNRDGKVTPNEIAESRKFLLSAEGNFDFDGDGKVTKSEQNLGTNYAGQMQRRDTNGDGGFNRRELNGLGARVLVDGNGDGQFDRCEQFRPGAIPTWYGGRASLDFFAPGFGNQVSYHQPGR